MLAHEPYSELCCPGKMCAPIFVEAHLPSMQLGLLMIWQRTKCFPCAMDDEGGRMGSGSISHRNMCAGDCSKSKIELPDGVKACTQSRQEKLVKSSTLTTAACILPHYKQNVQCVCVKFEIFCPQITDKMLAVTLTSCAIDYFTANARSVGYSGLTQTHADPRPLFGVNWTCDVLFRVRQVIFQAKRPLPF